MPTLRDKYLKEVAPSLGKELGVNNRLAIPRLVKVVVNMGIGIADKDVVAARVAELGLITGQRPIVTKAKKSISNFKLRKGASIGAKVTLRGPRMCEFLDRLINVALPRIRDFRGCAGNSFDGHGNYTMGIKEQIVFPEIDPNNVSQNQGMDITIVTTARNDSEAQKLLKMLGMPFADK